MYDYTMANKIIKFCETLKIPEGDKVGEPIVLIEWQKDFIREVFKEKNGKRVVKTGICSIGRKNSKSSTIAMILLSLMCIKGLAKPNAQLASGAKTRQQSALLFNLMSKFIQFSPTLQKRLKVTDSKKLITNMRNGCTYQSLAADAGSVLGLSLYVYVHDEGANLENNYSFPEACKSSQGSYDDALVLEISTIGSSDTYEFNKLVEQYKDNKDPSVYCIYYTVPENTPNMMTDPEVWKLANPSLGHFLSVDTMKSYADQAIKIPSKMSYFKNYLLNMKISSEQSFIQSEDWTAIAEEWGNTQIFTDYQQFAA